MAKRRSSLKGRGSEILFGEPAPVDIEPRGAVTALEELALFEPDPLEPEPVDEPLIDPEDETLSSSLKDEGTVAELEEELERALLEEARDGELAPGEEEDLSLVDEQPPPTPEMELAFFEEAVGVEESPEPVAEAPVPPLEETMEELPFEEEEMFYAPPPPEVSDLSTGVLPPRHNPIYFEMDDIEPLSTADIQGTDSPVKPAELPEREMTEEEKEKLIKRYGIARLNLLDREITKVYDLILTTVGENEDISTECYNLLLQARDIVLWRDGIRFPQAEYYVEQARARLRRATESEAGAQKYSWRITAWGFLWGAVFIILLILLNHTWFQDLLSPSTGGGVSREGEIFLRAMIWGGIGGVVAVLYSLFKHVGLRDFDSQYNLSYVGKPFLGLVLGATVYMIFQLMMTVGLLPAGLQTGIGTSAMVTPWIIYPLAWAGGFKENRIFDLVDRVIKRVFSGKEALEEAFPREPDSLTR